MTATYATLTYPTSGLTLNAGLYNSVGQIWNGSAYVDLSTLANLTAWRALLVAAPELELSDATGTATYQTGDISAAVEADSTCSAVFYSGATPTMASAIAQIDVGHVAVTLPTTPPTGYGGSTNASEYTGAFSAGVLVNAPGITGDVTLATNGLDKISKAAPTGAPSTWTFPQWMVWLIRRFARANKTGTSLDVFDENGVKITTQTISEDLTTIVGEPTEPS